MTGSARGVDISFRSTALSWRHVLGKRIACITVVSLALLGFAVLAPAEEPAGLRDPVRAKLVQDEVRIMMKATYGGDAVTVLRFMHASVIEAMGGKAKARQEVKAALDQLKRLSIVVEDLEFPDEPRFFAGKNRTFVLVPTRIIVAAGTQRAEVVSFQLGVRDDGSEGWAYLEGGKFSGKVRSEVFPDFPGGVELPPISRKAL